MFVRDITCLNRILYEDAYSSKINFSKSRVLWAGAYQNRINQQGQMKRSQSSIKILGVNFGKSILDNSNWDKISEGIINKFIRRTA